MIAYESILRGVLWAHVGYFCSMAAAHWFSFKKPVLFVYYDTPFHAYQDKIISFCVLTYVAMFTSAALHPVENTPFALFSIWTTVLGLAAINRSKALQKVLKGKSTFWYWAQVAMIASGAAVMTGLYAAINVQKIGDHTEL